VPGNNDIILLTRTGDSLNINWKM